MTYRDLVKQAASVTGTGAFTLGAAVDGYQTMNTGRAIGETIDYAFRKDTDWEVGVGTLTDALTLTRTAVGASSNGGTLVNFAAGTGEIVETVSAASLNNFAAVRDIPFSTTIPLTRPGSSYMAAQSVSGPLTFTAAAGAVRGALVYLRLIADGVNAPNFSAFKEWGGSSGYDNRNGIVNQMQFFYDGSDLFYTASQAIGAVPVAPPATAITMTGPTGGVSGAASSSFAVGASPVGGSFSGTIVVTPSSNGGGGTFNPASVSLTSAQPTATFTYTPASTGAKTISATNNGGLANPANITYTVTAAATVPDAPTIGTAVAGDGYVDVAFTAPSNTGGSVILDYTATLSTGETATGTTSPIRVTAANGTARTATVKARNSVGSSAASAASNSVTPAAASPRLTSLVNVTESGSPGAYTYAGDGTSDFRAASPFGPGGVIDKSLPANADGSFTLKATSLKTDYAVIAGFDPASTTISYTTMDYGIFSDVLGGVYKIITNGTVGTAGASVACQDGDTIRVRRVSGTISLEVARAATPTTWISVHTFGTTSTAAFYGHVLFAKLFQCTNLAVSGMV